MSDVWDDMVTVGRVVRPQGIRGEVVVAPETDFGPQRFRPGAVLHVGREGAVADLTIATSREFRGRWILGFEQVASVDDAEALRGADLRIPGSALAALGPGAYYVHDLVGCRIVTSGGKPVGVVKSVELTTGTPLLVADTAGGEVLVPLAEGICRRVDIGAKTIVIEPSEGLLEINE